MAPLVGSHHSTTFNLKEAMTDQATPQLILKELRALRSSFEVHKEDTGRRLSNIESTVNNLVATPGPVLVATNPRVRRVRRSWR